MKLSYANVRQAPSNTQYLSSIEIHSCEDLKCAVFYDHVCGEFKEGRRSNETFLRANCAMFDVDNTHSENQEDWITPEDISQSFPGVSFYIVYSRNHMKEKNGKDPRPKFHVYFSTAEFSSKDDYEKFKLKVCRYFPYFDQNAKDAARFFFGVDNPKVEYFDGDLLLSDFMDTVQLKTEVVDTLPTKSLLKATPELDIIPEGQRNSTLISVVAKIMKRWGDNEGSYSRYMQEAARCSPPLDNKELDSIWQSAQKLYHQTILTDPNYTPPEEYSPKTILSLFKPVQDFTEEEAQWLVPGWIPTEQITLIASDGGVGKTTFWVHLLAALSSGTPCVLDPPEYDREPMKVAFLTSEDSVSKKLRKKLRTAGADLSNIVTVDASADKEGLLRSLKFGNPEMAQVLRSLNVGACIFDPIQGFLPREVNMASRNAMRDCMAPLVALGEEVGTTFILICHTNKRQGAYGRNRVADSADLWDIARSVIMMGEADEEGLRYLSNEKNNYLPLQETQLFSISESGLIVPEGRSWKRDFEFTQGRERKNKAPKMEDCKSFILRTLSEAPEGEMRSTELENRAAQYGISHETYIKARGELSKTGLIRSDKHGSPRSGECYWTVRLLNDPQDLPPYSQYMTTASDSQ